MYTCGNNKNSENKSYVMANYIHLFYKVYLNNSISQMGLSTDEVGLVFLFCSILYGVSSPFWGYIADKYNNHWSMMAVGLFLSAIGLFILAPLPWLPVNKE